MGVAVITSTCGAAWALSVSAARCSTPKRCCSSTTTRPRSAKETRSSSRAWVPITMPASPLAIRSSASRRWAVFIEPVSRATLVPSSAPPSMPPGGQVAEHRADRAVVLLGEHLGGGEQRRLSPAVDDAQHRAERHQGLAGADLALEEAVHRVRLGEVGLELYADVALALGQLERQPLVEGGQQAPSPGARPGTLGADRGPAPYEHELGGQRLLEAEPLAARRRPGPSRRGRGSTGARSRRRARRTSCGGRRAAARGSRRRR